MNEEICPRCHESRLRRWDELSDEEQEVVRRLPGSTDFTLTERQARHRWCSRCWFEATNVKDNLV